MSEKEYTEKWVAPPELFVDYDEDGFVCKIGTKEGVTLLQLNEQGDLFVRGKIYPLCETYNKDMNEIYREKAEHAGKMFGLVGVAIAIIFAMLGWFVGINI